MNNLYWNPQKFLDQGFWISNLDLYEMLFSKPINVGILDLLQASGKVGMSFEGAPSNITLHYKDCLHRPAVEILDPTTELDELYLQLVQRRVGNSSVSHYQALYPTYDEGMKASLSLHGLRNQIRLAEKYREFSNFINRYLGGIGWPTSLEGAKEFCKPRELLEVTHMSDYRRTSNAWPTMPTEVNFKDLKLLTSSITLAWFGSHLRYPGWLVQTNLAAHKKRK